MCDSFICKYISLSVDCNKSCEYCRLHFNCEYCIFYEYDETGSVAPQFYCSI